MADDKPGVSKNLGCLFVTLAQNSVFTCTGRHAGKAGAPRLVNTCVKTIGSSNSESDIVVLWFKPCVDRQFGRTFRCYSD